MRNHLHHAAGHAQARARSAIERPEHEKAERDEAHVRDRRIRDQLLHVFLHQRDETDVDHGDQRQRDHHVREILAAVRNDRQRQRTKP